MLPSLDGQAPATAARARADHQALRDYAAHSPRNSSSVPSVLSTLWSIQLQRTTVSLSRRTQKGLPVRRRRWRGASEGGCRGSKLRSCPQLGGRAATRTTTPHPADSGRRPSGRGDEPRAGAPRSGVPPLRSRNRPRTVHRLRPPTQIGSSSTVSPEIRLIGAPRLA